MATSDHALSPAEESSCDRTRQLGESLAVGVGSPARDPNGMDSAGVGAGVGMLTGVVPLDGEGLSVVGSLRLREAEVNQGTSADAVSNGGPDGVSLEDTAGGPTWKIGLAGGGTTRNKGRSMAGSARSNERLEAASPGGVVAEPATEFKVP
jgi:hypothetical protein